MDSFINPVHLRSLPEIEHAHIVLLVEQSTSTNFLSKSSLGIISYRGHSAPVKFKNPNLEKSIPIFSPYSNSQLFGDTVDWMNHIDVSHLIIH